MSDRPATLFLIAAVILTALFLRRAQAAGALTVTQDESTKTPLDKVLGGNPLDRLLAFAASLGLRVGKNPTGGRHVKGSLHYQGRAIDVGTRGLSEADIQGIYQAAAQKGIGVLDERTQPPGEWQWTGPHLHLYVP